jgi:microcystin-dependent protein
LSSQYLGEIRLFSFNFAPKYWAQCNGQLLSIQQYAALFSLLGTYFGGNGIQTFGLPDMRSRVPLSQSLNGQYIMGQMAGNEAVTLNANQLPQHQHFLQAVNNNTSGVITAIGHLLAVSTSTAGSPNRYAPGNTGNLTTLNPNSVQPVGSTQPHTNIQPYLAMEYCIALQGIFPSRN